MLLCLLSACRPSEGGEGGEADTAPAATCAPGERDDGGTCVPEACGTGPWGDVPDTGVVYVDGRTDGDGSRESPLRSIQRGLDVAKRVNATLVAVADGTYAEGVDFLRAHDGITLHGRCSARVILDAGGLDRQLAMQLYATAGSPTFGVSGITVRGADVSGIRVLGSVAMLRDVRLEGLDEQGIQLEQGADVTLEDVVVTGTRASRAGWAEGLRVTDDARLVARGLRIEDSAGVGVYVDGAGARATFEDLVVRGLTTERSIAAASVAVVGDVEVSLSGGAIEAPVEGVAVSAPGGTVTIEDTELTGGPEGSPHGAGLDVREGGVATLRNVRIHGIAGFGIFARDDGTVLQATDVSVRDVTAASRNTGRGVEVDAGAHADLTRVSVHASTDAALFVGGGTVTTDDSVFAETRERDGGGGGRGVEIGFGGAATLLRTQVTDNVEVGVFVADASTLTLDDVDLAYTHARADGRRGVGLEVVHSVATVTGSRITGNQLINLLVAGDSQVDLTDTELRDTRGNASAAAGWGAQASGTARLRMSGGAIRDSAFVGLVLTDGARGELRDVDVAGATLLRGIRSAVGILVRRGGSLDMQGGAVHDNAGPGIALYGAEARVVDTRVNGNTYAAVSAFDDSRLTLERVRIEDTVEGAESGTFGVLAQAGTTGGPDVTVRESEIGAHTVAGVWLSGRGTLQVEDSDLEVGPGTPRGATLAHGNAVFATGQADVGVSLHLAGNRFHGEGGVPVLLHHAGGTFGDNAWETSGIHVAQQACGALTPLETVPGATIDVCPPGSRLVDLSYEVPVFALPDAELDE